MKSTLTLGPEIAATIDCADGEQAELVVKGTIKRMPDGSITMPVIESAEEDEDEDAKEPAGEEEEEAPPAPKGKNPAVMAVIAAGKK